MLEAKLHTLHGPDFSLVLEETEDRQLLWRHWGSRADTKGLPPLQQVRARSTFALDQEVPLTIIPTAGLGWFGAAGLRCQRDDLPLVLRLAVEAVESEHHRLSFVLTDAAAGVELTISFIAQGNCVRIRSTLVNRGVTSLGLDWLSSAILPIPYHARSIVSFTGRHEGEFVEHLEPMPLQTWLKETHQGLTGHGGPPGAFILGEGAGWHEGEVWAVQLAWSGDYRIVMESDGFGAWVLLAGSMTESPKGCLLAPGGRFEAPEVLACFSRQGRNGAIAGFHSAVRAEVRWPGETMRPRPVHFNTWESVYFAHDETRMIELVERAAELGVERFVLDDGWFEGRDSDCAGLGDWKPDRHRYPNGLGPVAERAIDLGMEFGLWVEPEMVNSESDLYRTHPDWVLGSSLGKQIPEARHQLVLDMARPDVREHLFAQLADLVGSLPISYLKWDHNRVIAPAHKDLGRPGYAQVRGTWSLWDRLRKAFPHLEIEACAAGGGRIDAGFAARAHRFWTSDNIDALSRIPIQRGFLQFLPPEMMGSHVGACPAHSTGRIQSVDFRAMVALPGHFGIELDPQALEICDRERLIHWIARYKALRDRFHSGPCRLGEGGDGLVWQAHGPNDAMLVLVARSGAPARRRECALRLPMLLDEGPLRVRLLDHCGTPSERQPPLLDTYLGGGVSMNGSWIASHGLQLPRIGPEGVLLLEVGRA